MSPQTHSAEVHSDPSGSPAFLSLIILHASHFFRLLCFSTFHRQFAVTDWPEKLLFLFLKFFSNTIKVFLTCSLSFQCHSSPFSLWNDAFPFSRSKNFLCCHFSYFPNISLRIEISQNVFLAFYKAFEDFSLSLWKTFFHFLEIPLFVSSFFLFWKQLIEKQPLLKISLLFKRTLFQVS